MSELDASSQPDLSRPAPVQRVGSHALRRAWPWTATNHALLRHLENVGFDACPRVVGDGFDDTGREVLTWIDGEVVHPQPWDAPEPALFEVGQLMRQLHRATSSFVAPANARWMPWTLHEHGPHTIVSHCNIAPWNIINRNNQPVAFIGWEYAGPTDRLNEIAATGWYCAQLHGHDVAELVGLPEADVRAGWLKAFLDGYELPARERVGLVTRMIEFAIRDTAGYARVQGINPQTTDANHIWLMAWQVRAADWMLQHRRLLQSTIERA
jgi:Choline/ethanolamine kinase